jgi:DNA modification methylase
MPRLICGDVLDVLPRLGQFACLIADPPDNIGLAYSGYNDRKPIAEYKIQFAKWLDAFIASAKVVWVSFNARHLWWVARLVDERISSNLKCRLFIQRFTFGAYLHHDAANCFRPILRIMRKDAKLYPRQILVPSQRLLIGDKRAKPAGRIPGDVWDFPRITGNSRERRRHHPTQLREDMIRRMVNFSSKPGESVCDCFSGTGTVLRAVKDRDVIAIEISPYYCDMIAKEHGLEVEK